MKALPPWWILNGVKPQGPEKDMGTWKAISFSPEQQEQFGVDDEGKVQDQAKFDAAIAALKAPAQAAPGAGEAAADTGGEKKRILHTVLFRLPDVSEEVYAKMQETIARLGGLEGIAVSFRPAGAPGLSLADTLAALEWPDKTEGYTHCMNLIADDIPSLKAYLHSSLHKEEWVGHMKPAGSQGPPLVFDSELALSAMAGKIQHVVLFKLPELPGEVYERMQETVGRFNEMAGMTASFRPAGAPGMSFAETLAALEWPDKANGYTHCLHVIADDMASLKAYFHSALHKEEWVGHMKPAGATGPPLVFDTELVFPMSSAL
jgi:hypothetical protein